MIINQSIDMYSNIGATESVGIKRYSSLTYETIEYLDQNFLAKKCMLCIHINFNLVLHLLTFYNSQDHQI